MLFLNEDTIVARATPPGEGAIAIVRLSGRQAVQIADELFRTRSGKSLASAPSHTLLYGVIVDPQNDEPIDEVLIVKMQSPHSYTGEDMVEIYCHSGIAVVTRIIELALQKGARLAEPGEFTKRAFLNGRIDLVQAEAVADIVSAKTEQARRLAMRQLKGDLSGKLNEIRERLLDVATEIEARIDFPEEEIPQADKTTLIDSLKYASEELNKLIKRGEQGRIIREGARVIFVGRPNTGKSSLFNALLGMERAIVTPHPGTTRDTIESTISISGVPITLVDTAGMRSARDEIEMIGLKRTQDEIHQADLIVVLFDVSEELQSEDLELWKLVRNKDHLVVLNKIDLPRKTHISTLQDVLPDFPPDEQVIEVSALRRLNLDMLENEIIKKLMKTSQLNEDGLLISNLRHIEGLRKAEASLKNAISLIRDEAPDELVMIELNDAIKQINSVLGLEVDDEILDRIFSRFCIGK